MKILIDGNELQWREVIKMEYQAPELIEIGSFEEMTLGSKFTDTADENAYQN
jgi:hypothetical protein